MIYGYIKYMKGGKRAILPFSLILRFAPKSTEDLTPTFVKAY